MRQGYQRYLHSLKNNHLDTSTLKINWCPFPSALLRMLTVARAPTLTAPMVWNRKGDFLWNILHTEFCKKSGSYFKSLQTPLRFEVGPGVYFLNSNHVTAEIQQQFTLTRLNGNYTYHLLYVTFTNSALCPQSEFFCCVHSHSEVRFFRKQR
jgi:hypothetical protein